MATIPEVAQALRSVLGTWADEEARDDDRSFRY